MPDTPTPPPSVPVPAVTPGLMGKVMALWELLTNKKTTPVAVISGLVAFGAWKVDGYVTRLMDSLDKMAVTFAAESKAQRDHDETRTQRLEDKLEKVTDAVHENTAEVRRVKFGAPMGKGSGPVARERAPMPVRVDDQ